MSAGELGIFRHMSSLKLQSVRLPSCLHDSVMFLDVVTWLQNHCHLEHFKTICVIWWRLWSFRNAFVHGGATPLVSSAMHWSACFVGDCLVKSPAVERGLSRCKDIKWKPPNAGRFKLNTDARIDESL
ncbi:hypothetical protein ACOSP7_000763 [Xanthoceras sorbifolium]